ncbi:MAG: hypothetical protein H0X29_07115 [Parachlamydiaceae bacterium]|nr:hypothetical protein [Parachlamydiaceae bacterium]
MGREIAEISNLGASFPPTIDPSIVPTTAAIFTIPNPNPTVPATAPAITSAATTTIFTAVTPIPFIIQYTIPNPIETKLLSYRL